MGKLTCRQKHSMETKNKIYESAVRLFSENGYTDVTVSEICREANVAIGVFYYYFPSKNAILDQTYAILCMNIEKQMQTLTEVDPNENIRALVKYICGRFERRGVIFMSLLLKNELDKRDYYEKSPKNMYGFVKSAVDKAVSRGFLTGDAEVIANDIFKNFRGATFDWIVRNGMSNLEQEAARGVDILLGYYARKDI